MKLLIAGSRQLCPSIEIIDAQVATFRRHCHDLGFPWWREIDTVISGGARGVDAHGEQWARARGHQVERFEANWNVWGKRAGMIRNRKMAQACALGLIFWDGESRGTKNMIDLLHEFKRPYRVIPATELPADMRGLN